MKYWKLGWTSWTNYYVLVDLEVPIIGTESSEVDHKQVQLQYYPINCIILGKPGEPSVCSDLDLFMLGVETAYVFNANLGRENLKESPCKFESKEITEWIIKNYKNRRLSEQLRLSRPRIKEEVDGEKN